MEDEPQLSDGRRRRGRQTRAAILSRAVDIASAEGLDSVSLARLAGELGISKSGVSGHFSSREGLQLAVVEVAARLYTARIVVPARAVAPGLPQLWRFTETWIEFMRSGELSGRSFFLTAVVEYDARPGPIRDEILRLRLRWEEIFTGTWTAALELGHVHPGTDPQQLFYEIAALITGATLDAQIRDDLTAFDRARTAVLARLRPLATSPGTLPR